MQQIIARINDKTSQVRMEGEIAWDVFQTPETKKPAFAGLI
jgi:hypothetical protein